ncbi:hypothetical protein HDU87_005469, partial [Geranomyces variabilis]
MAGRNKSRGPTRVASLVAAHHRRAQGRYRTHRRIPKANPEWQTADALTIFTPAKAKEQKYSELVDCDVDLFKCHVSMVFAEQQSSLWFPEISPAKPVIDKLAHTLWNVERNHHDMSRLLTGIRG